MVPALVLLIPLLPAALGGEQVYLTEPEALRIAFPGADVVEKRFTVLDDAQRRAVAESSGRPDPPRIVRHWVGRRAGALLGFAAIEDCRGKSEPITYMVAVDPAGAISAVEILVYRESRGAEVRHEGWRDQFEGKTIGDALRVGEDIRNIAGATISCRSVTDDVRLRIACLAEIARREHPARTPDPSGPVGGFRRSRIVMGTPLEIQVHAPDGDRARAAVDAAFAEVERLDRLLSTYVESSEISSLNREAGGAFQAASPELLDLLVRCQGFHSETAGAFDASAGALVMLWKQAAERGAAPTRSAVEDARALCGPSLVEIDPEHGRARISRAGAALDLGGIGKGYALDRAAAVLEAHGESCALLDFGGQVLALDPPPGRVGWEVDLRDARDPGRIGCTIRLARASIATTADYERGLRIGGSAVSHVVDPRTGKPAQGLLGASVVCRTAMQADALSTALFVLGPDAGAELAGRRGLACLLVPTRGEEVRSDAFRDLERSAPAPR